MLQVIRFRGSVMQRVLLGLDVMIDVAHFFPDKAALFCRPLRLRVWTSHLESCANFAEERKRQLQQSWQLMLLALEGTEPGANRADCSIFCGDMNVRDSEVRLDSFLFKWPGNKQVQDLTEVSRAPSTQAAFRAWNGVRFRFPSMIHSPSSLLLCGYVCRLLVWYERIYWYIGPSGRIDKKRPCSAFYQG